MGGLSGFASGGPAGAAIGAIGGGLGGGSSSGGSGGGGGSSMGVPIDYYAKYGAMAAAANSPITLAGMRYGTTLQGLAGSQGLLAVSYTHLTLPTNREV